MERYLIKACKDVSGRLWLRNVLYFHDEYNWHAHREGALVYDKRGADANQQDRQAVEDMFPSVAYRIDAEEVL